MRVFLTGSSGKIGSAVKRIFGEAGHEVVGYDTVSYTHLTLPTKA